MPIRFFVLFFLVYNIHIIAYSNTCSPCQHSNTHMSAKNIPRKPSYFLYNQQKITDAILSLQNITEQLDQYVQTIKDLTQANINLTQDISAQASALEQVVTTQTNTFTILEEKTSKFVAVAQNIKEKAQENREILKNLTDSLNTFLKKEYANVIKLDTLCQSICSSH